MPETQRGQKNGNAGDATDHAKPTFDAGAEGKERVEAAQAAAKSAAEAGQEAVRAQQEILRTNVETAQEVMRTGIEASTKAFETLTGTWTRALGMSPGDGGVTQHPAQNVRLVSQATTALARGAQEASHAWMRLIQQSARVNLEAVTQLAGCRSVQDVFAVQSNVARDNLERLIEGGQTIAASNSRAVDEASRAMHPPR